MLVEVLPRSDRIRIRHSAETSSSTRGGYRNGNDQFGNEARNQYAKLFREDKAMTDLGRWHMFKTAHPSRFSNMYQFRLH